MHSTPHAHTAGRNADPTVVIPIPVELEPEANAIGQGK